MVQENSKKFFQKKRGKITLGIIALLFISIIYNAGGTGATTELDGVKVDYEELQKKIVDLEVEFESKEKELNEIVNVLESKQVEVEEIEEEVESEEDKTAREEQEKKDKKKQEKEKAEKEKQEKEKKQKEAEKLAEDEYRSELLDVSSDLSVEFGNFGGLFLEAGDNPFLMYDEDWIINVVLSLTYIGGYLDIIDEIKAPPKYQAADEKIKEASEHYRIAIDGVPSAVDNGDWEKLDELSDHLVKGNDLIDEGVAELESIE